MAFMLDKLIVLKPYLENLRDIVDMAIKGLCYVKS